MTTDDEEIARWYGDQRLSDAALTRLVAMRPPARRTWWPWALAVAAAAMLVVWRPHEPRTLPATPIRFAAALEVPRESREPVALIPLEGWVRTEVHPADRVSHYLNPGNFVDVLVGVGVGNKETRTAYHAVFVLDVAPDRHTVGLMMRPEADAALRAERGEVFLTVRNDLDVAYSSDVDVGALLHQDVPESRRALPLLPEPPAVASGVRGTDVVRTRLDPASTFGLEADTASFGYARARLSHGHRPDPADIRVEDFVNAMAYDYPRAAGGALFAAAIEVVPSPWTVGYDLVRIGLRARDTPASGRPAVHLTFLVDTSGSMASQLALVQDSLRALVERLQPGDTVGLVTFADTAVIALPPTLVTEDDVVYAAIAALRAGGGTGLEAGLEAAYGSAVAGLAIPGEHRVILATDGMANLGATDAAALTARVRAEIDRGITLTAVGFGREGLRDELLEQFADASDGTYGYVETADQMVQVVVPALTTVARDAKAELTWDPDAVVGWRRIGYDDRQLPPGSLLDDRLDGGEIAAGQRTTVLYEVLRVPGADGPLGTLVVRARDPASEQRFEVSGPVVAPGSDTRVAIAAASLGLSLANDPILGLDLGRVYALAEAAKRGDRPGDADLLTMTRQASWRLAPPGRHCREVAIVSNGQKKVVLLDSDQNRCW